MSDVWISRPRWTCKYCNITINDDAPSRRQHENGFRHKGNVERAVRDATKSKHRDEAEQARARKEMQKIERLAAQSHAADQASQSASSGVSDATAPQAGPSRSSPTAAPKAPTAWRPKDLAAHSESPLARQMRAEEEAQVAAATKDEEDGGENGVKAANVGEWETVAVAPAATQSTAERAVEIRERPVYKIREKQGNYDREDDDEERGPLHIRTKRKIRIETEEEKQRSMVPSWKPMRIDMGIGGIKSEGPQAVPIQRIPREEVNIKDERPDEGRGPVKQEDADLGSVAPATESSAPSSSGMFKKRKAGAGAGAKKVRAVI